PGFLSRIQLSQGCMAQVNGTAERFLDSVVVVVAERWPAESLQLEGSHQGVPMNDDQVPLLLRSVVAGQFEPLRLGDTDALWRIPSVEEELGQQDGDGIEML